MNVCVFCGSSDGRAPSYKHAAAELGHALAQRNNQLVYGGASVGLMGSVADAALAENGKVIGVLPQSLADRELAHPGLTELHIVDSMHTRKARMAELADCFIALPGGIGTLEEVFEVWTWAQLGFHNKPLGLLNLNGYYDDLIRFLDHVTAEHFVATSQRDRLLVDQTPAGLLSQLETNA